MIPFAITYPSWIHPEIFPGVPFLGIVRWYGLMYVCAFATAFVIFKRLSNEKALNTPSYTITEDDLFSCFTTGILFLIVGARVFSTLVYDTSDVYRQKPWLIFWPFDTATGRFTGLAGMSYHGGFIGCLCGVIFWCVRHKKPLLKWMDALSVCIPAGYTFGRIGNFLNGELFGRITTRPWGVIFPNANTLTDAFSYQPWVQDFLDKAGLKAGIDIQITGLVNLPRHPSQLYEAFFEGIVLFLFLWSIRKHKPFDGFLAAMYTVGYGFVRFFIEYFRQPDAELGYRIIADATAPTYLNTSLLNLSTGQVFCMVMIALGLTLIVVLAVRKNLQRRTESSV